MNGICEGTKHYPEKSKTASQQEREIRYNKRNHELKSQEIVFPSPSLFPCYGCAVTSHRTMQVLLKARTRERCEQ